MGDIEWSWRAGDTAFAGLPESEHPDARSLRNLHYWEESFLLLVEVSEQWRACLSVCVRVCYRALSFTNLLSSSSPLLLLILSR